MGLLSSAACFSNSVCASNPRFPCWFLSTSHMLFLFYKEEAGNNPTQPVAGLGNACRNLKWLNNSQAAFLVKSYLLQYIALYTIHIVSKQIRYNKQESNQINDANIKYETNTVIIQLNSIQCWFSSINNGQCCKIDQICGLMNNITEQ